MTGYRERVGAALEGGWRFAGLHASVDGTVVRALLAGPDGSLRLEDAAVEGSRVPSIVDMAPAAGWDEREAADLHALVFAGHEPLRPLLDHGASNDRWTVRVSGADAYEIAVGPIHAGVIESGHFRFHVVGDRILQLDARLFYKHRGLEQAAEGTSLEDGAAYVARACAACAVTNGVAYAHACEEALGLETTAELARARTILLELERVWSHLNDIAAVCAGVGLAAGNNLFARFDRASAPPQRRADGPPLPVRHRPCRRKRARTPPRGRRRSPRRARLAAPPRGERLAGARLQLLVPGPASGDRRRHRRRTPSGSGGRPGGACGRPGRRRPGRVSAARL